LSADGLEGLDALEGAQVLFAADSGRAHNDDSYDEVFLAHYQRIVALLSHLLSNRARAEEVASEVFWRAYRGTMRWEDGRLGGWLYRTATNLGIEELRARGRREQHEEEAAQQRATDPRTPLEELLHAERAARVRSVLASLKVWQARILVLRSSGLSYVELAQAMRIKPGSVGTMLARAEAQFRRQYAQTYGAEE
jgi:RNA polymerase sigma-70 factor (ECF subfamily)